MSVTAGITARLDGHRAYGPAARSNSTRSVRKSRHGRAHVLQHTGAESGQAPPKTRFLVGLARPRKMVSSRAARPEIENGLQTRFEQAANVDIRHEEILDEFGTPHLAEKNSRCRNHRRRPEMMLRLASTRFFSQHLAERLRGAAQMALPLRQTNCLPHRADCAKPIWSSPAVGLIPVRRPSSRRIAVRTRRSSRCEAEVADIERRFYTYHPTP